MVHFPREKIKNCIALTVTELAKKEIIVSINSISLNDKKTLQLYCDGDIKYVFNATERETPYLKQINKLKFDDLVNISVLTMPRKEHFIEPYIKSRNKFKQVTYLHPLLKPILNHTQGLILFYEQFVEIFKQFGNLSYGEAFLLIDQFCIHGINSEDPITFKFIENAQNKHGLSERTMDKLLTLITESFILVPRLYHMTEFTLLSYQTAYLKAHYPNEYVKTYKKHFPKTR